MGAAQPAVRGRHGSCVCESQTSSGSSARTKQLAFRLRVVELAEPDRHVAADDHRPTAGLDDDHLRAGCVARRRDEPDPDNGAAEPIAFFGRYLEVTPPTRLSWTNEECGTGWARS